MASAETTMILAGSFALGLSHAFEIDHMTAVSHFVAARPRPREAAVFGLKWALGHGTSLLLFGSLLFALRMAIGDSTAHFFERLVGLALLAMGAGSLLRLRARGAVASHSHDGSFWMGILHGVAGTAAFVGQSLVALSSSYVFVLLYTLAFSAGVLVAMALFAGVLGGVIRRLNGHGAQRRLQAALALWTCALGCVWLLR